MPAVEQAPRSRETYHPEQTVFRGRNNMLPGIADVPQEDAMLHDFDILPIEIEQQRLNRNGQYLTMVGDQVRLAFAPAVAAVADGVVDAGSAIINSGSEFVTGIGKAMQTLVQKHPALARGAAAGLLLTETLGGSIACAVQPRTPTGAPVATSTPSTGEAQSLHNTPDDPIKASQDAAKKNATATATAAARPTATARPSGGGEAGSFKNSRLNELQDKIAKGLANEDEIIEFNKGVEAEEEAATEAKKNSLLVPEKYANTAEVLELILPNGQVATYIGLARIGDDIKISVNPGNNVSFSPIRQPSTFKGNVLVISKGDSNISFKGNIVTSNTLSRELTMREEIATIQDIEVENFGYKVIVEATIPDPKTGAVISDIELYKEQFSVAFSKPRKRINYKPQPQTKSAGTVTTSYQD